MKIRLHTTRILYGIWVIVFIFFLNTPNTYAQIITDDPLISKEEYNQLIQQPQTRITIPGLRFTKVGDVEDLVTEEIGPDGIQRKYINIPFLGQYIATAYRYFIVVIGIFAVMSFIQAGFGFAFSGGMPDKINIEKERMVRSIAGLLLAVGSYVLLYNLNPELVEFKNLKAVYVQEQQFNKVANESGDLGVKPDGKTTTKTEDITSIVSNLFTQTTINGKTSDGWKIWSELNETEKKEVMPNLFVVIGECPGQEEKINSGIEHCNLEKTKVHQSIIPALKIATNIAKREGFEICSTPSRSVLRQAQLWNTGVVARFAQKAKRWQTNNGLIASPSCNSPHVTGGAVDISLKKNGKVVLGSGNTALETPTINSYKKIYFENGEDGLYKLILEEIMIQAGWVRFCKEYWHFETGVTIRYSKWDKNPETRCVHAYDNWKLKIPNDIKTKANELTKNKNLFKVE